MEAMRLLTPLSWSLADALEDETSQWAGMEGLTVGSLFRSEGQRQLPLYLSQQ